MAGKYASTTTVSTENSRAEIEKTLRRYGADAFMYASETRMAVVGFRIGGRQIRFKLTMPDPKDRAFTQHSRGARTAEAAQREWEQACRSSWRALALVIKAKLEAVAAGITTIEDEFLAHTLLPNGSTVGDHVREDVRLAYESGAMPPSLRLEGPR